MSQAERPSIPIDAHHYNPEVVEWSLPEEGIVIRLRLDQPGMAELSATSRENLVRASSLFALLCDYVVANREVLQGTNLPTEAAFSFIAEHTKDMTSMFRMMTGELEPTQRDEFPF